jgi:hypothetical protein
MEKDLESIEATIDNCEVSDHSEHADESTLNMSYHHIPQFKFPEHETPCMFDSNDNIPMINIDQAVDHQITTSQISEKAQLSENVGESATKPTKLRRKKLFSKRKDVIIKTLLRKCRKFFVKDFNTSTDYKKLKRRQGNQVYKDLITTYLTNLLGESVNDSLIAFFGAFVYKADFDANMDSFYSGCPNLTQDEIQTQAEKIHEILYSYSHQKFRTFKDNLNFMPIFMHFYKNGSETLKKDPESRAGLEIIHDQLLSSLQES